VPATGRNCHYQDSALIVRCRRLAATHRFCDIGFRAGGARRTATIFVAGASAILAGRNDTKVTFTGTLTSDALDELVVTLSGELSQRRGSSH